MDQLDSKINTDITYVRTDRQHNKLPVDGDGSYSNLGVDGRIITIDNTRIHIKSIFTGQREFEEALQSIVMRRLMETK